MKKLGKILIVLIIIGIFLNIAISRYIVEKNNISRKLGQVTTGGSISTVNYVNICKNMEFYLTILRNKNYEDAYKVLPYFYTEYKSFSDYVKENEIIDYNKVFIKNVMQRAQNLYSIYLDVEENEREYLLLLSNQNTSFSVIPEPFLEYNVIDRSIKRKKVKYEIIDTTNYVEKFVVNINVANLSKNDEVKLSDIKLIKESGKYINTNNEFPIEIKPNEEIYLKLEFDTNIDFPKQIEISREFEEKNIIEKYSIEL